MSHTSILQFRTANCKNCYKCIRNCPVKAIRVTNQQAQIIEEQCILCEKCIAVCPQHAKVEHDDIPAIQRVIASGKKVIASVHPAYLARYGWNSIGDLEKYLQKMGFWQAFDAAQGAAVMKEEYTRLLQGTTAEKTGDLIELSGGGAADRDEISSSDRISGSGLFYEADACSIFKRAISRRIYRIHQPVYFCNVRTERAPVMRGLCITFGELNNWMKDIQEKPEREDQKDVYLSRMTAVSGGLIQAMQPINGQKYLSVDGIDQCKEILKELRTGDYADYFIEMNACTNGCIGGAYSLQQEKKLLDALIAIRELSMKNGQVDYQKDHHIQMPEIPERKFVQEETYPEKAITKEQFTHVMHEMGKYTKEDELNCGACGYDTCRAKAIAVIQGKAEVSMCIPYMREKQEDYANIIIEAMPGLLVTVDYDLNIIQMNKAANDLFDISRKKQLLGKAVGEIMDDYPIINMIAFNREIVQDCIYLNEQKRYIERVLTNDWKNKLILCIMKDVTREKESEKKQNRAKAEAVQMADKLAAEQLRIVHEIASLLGETAADTKVAIEELKQTILQEIK